MKKISRIEGFITGLVLAAAFLRVSFEKELPDHVLVPITAVALIGATVVIFLLLNRSYSSRKNNRDSESN
jgi:hypothetical protein